MQRSGNVPEKPRRSRRLQGAEPSVTRSAEEDDSSMNASSSTPSTTGEKNRFVNSTKSRFGTSAGSRESSVKTTASSIQRRRRELELKALETEAEIEEEAEKAAAVSRKLERARTIAKKRFEVEMANLDEEDEGSQDMSDSEESGSRAADGPPKETAKVESKIASWLETNSQTQGEHGKVTVDETQGEPLSTTEIHSAREIKPQAPTSQTAVTDSCAAKTEGADLSMYIARQCIAKDLPKFTGKALEWPAFHSQYTGSNEACKFSAFENMSRLKVALKDDALEAVRSMLDHPNNLGEVLKILQGFGRPKRIVEALVSEAKKAPSPLPSRPESFTRFAHAVRNLVYTMESTKTLGHMENPTLMGELVGKLPDNYKMYWGEVLYDNPEKENLRGFSTWLSRKAEAAAYVADTVPDPQSEESKLSRRNHCNRNQRNVNQSLHAKQADDKQQHCNFCGRANHRTWECNDFSRKDNEGRWQLVKEKKVCFSCLGSGHRAAECRRKKVCGIDGCTAKHHHLLHTKSAHHSNPPDNAQRTHSQTSRKPEAPSEIRHVALRVGNAKLVHQRVVAVTVKGPKGSVDTFALLDDGSDLTLMDTEIAKCVGAVGIRERLRLNWISEGERGFDSWRTNVEIESADGISFLLEDVRTVTNMNLPVQTVNVEKLAAKWEYLRNRGIEKLVTGKPTLLIGQDHINFIITRESIEGPTKNSPTLSRCDLGWALHGRMTSGRVDTNFSLFTWSQQQQLDELDKVIKDSFSTESFGVKATRSPLLSKWDERAEKIISETTVKVDGPRWEVGLLWKKDGMKLPQSRVNALSRLHGIERKLEKNPVLAQQYVEKLRGYVEKGYARQLNQIEIDTHNPITWYLPHFATFQPNKPGKWRLVFDAAAKSSGICLNDMLLTGPDKLTPLLSVLLTFREEKIGFCADVREMFHQVLIRKEDQSAQRFLWREMDRSRPPDEYVMQVMTFGATCSPCLAQEIKNRNALQYMESKPEAVEAILKHQYVDDYLGGADSPEKSLALIRDIVYIQKQGGFELCKWSCSNREVFDQIPAELRSEQSRSLSASTELASERVLGMNWDPNADEFSFSYTFPKVKGAILEGAKIPTKREILRVVMSVYDPLGLLSVFTVRAKILMQDVWRTQIGWDDQIPHLLMEKWKDWLAVLNRVHELKIPRWYSYGQDRNTPAQLHVFCDASPQAFGAVAYLRLGEANITTALSMAKSRVAPLKPMSMPRLELQAAVMGCRIATTLKTTLQLKIERTVMWGDSTTVLHWIRSDARKYKVFVAHRIGEILESTTVEEWRWLPSEENVADELTRDTSLCDFSPNSRWVNGPAFLRHSEEFWPSEEVGDGGVVDDESEMCLHVVHHRPWIDVTRFSWWGRLLRVVAYVVRFIRRLRQRTRPGHAARGQYSAPLTVEEIETAQTECLRLVQVESFQHELRLLREGKEIGNDSRLRKLSPALDDQGLIRLHGRLQKSPELGPDGRSSIILDPHHHVTRLLVQHYHRLMNHQGQETVLNELRQRFWIIDGRAAVRSAAMQCFVCSYKRAHPLPPKMGELPPERVTRQSRPFIHTGLDFFGPIMVTVKRSTEKRYGALFTCLTTRAVHMEVAHSLCTDAAIMAIRRFIARRGCPKKLFSDNGTNFHGANNELKRAIKELDAGAIQTKMTTLGIDWHFIPPGAPHMGGCWERMVRSVKTAIGAVLKNRSLKDETLLTVIAEAENIVNSHPLTHVSVDHRDPESLTPNHFLIGISGTAPLPGVFDETDLCLRKHWRFSQRLADHFWQRWVREYLPTLTRRTKWNRTERPAQIGDFVIIADNDSPRNSWPKGLVTAVFPGKDGIVRVVDVKTATGTLRRPLSKVCILDLSSGKHDQDEVKTGCLSLEGE